MRGGGSAGGKVCGGELGNGGEQLGGGGGDDVEIIGDEEVGGGGSILETLKRGAVGGNVKKKIFTPRRSTTPTEGIEMTVFGKQADNARTSRKPARRLVFDSGLGSGVSHCSGGNSRGGIGNSRLPYDRRIVVVDEPTE